MQRLALLRACQASGAVSVEHPTSLQGARELVAVWGFLHTFGEMLGVWPASLAELLAALVDGSSSRLTAELHIGLLRLLQVGIYFRVCYQPCCIWGLSPTLLYMVFVYGVI